MTMPRNLACKEGLACVPKHSHRTCCHIGGGQKSVFSSFLADFSARLVRSIGTVIDRYEFIIM